MGRTGVVLFALLMASVFVAADDSMYCSVAADRASGTYDYLYQHVPLIEQRLDMLQQAPGINQTTMETHLGAKMNEGFGQISADVDNRMQSYELIILLESIVGPVLGFAGCMALNQVKA